jgi:catechol 2,3-dioxygenase-like lactoylglutathione lyase family enzyme
VPDRRDTGSVINGGNATIYVTELERAVDFYTRTLGLPLVYQAGEHWASIRAGGLEIGLHPAGSHTPTPGTAGAVTVGLSVDEPIDQVVSVLQARGVVFDGPVTDDGPVKLAFFADPDGNALYLAEETGLAVDR